MASRRGSGVEKGTFNKRPTRGSVTSVNKDSKRRYGSPRQVRSTRAPISSSDFASSCGYCHESVHENDPAIECELCQIWFHCYCQQVSTKLYELLGEEPDTIHWYCNICNGHARSMLQTMTQLQNQHDNLRQEFNELKRDVNGYREECRETYKTVNRKLADINNVGIGVASGFEQDTVDKVEKLISDKFVEMDEKERRKPNLIFFGIPEPKSSNPEDRKEDDFQKVKSLVQNSLGSSRPAELRALYRLGKKTDACRPLKVVLESESSRNEVLRKFKSEVGEGDRLIVVTKDRTRSERDAYKKLRSDLKARSENGEQNLVIRNGRIVQVKSTSTGNGDANLEINKVRTEKVNKHANPGESLQRSFRQDESSRETE